ncbi:hypothetical protein P153DRAFT_362286 [Dothidotthia symphoricarpi CBS 119687]|uniref:Hepatocellular carcinoma-associated antigen 59-domain-containing protein n=1 Tax=Dothidotthia symphoricarpi CBS 119687 TaxID=1392245 RepID=A0A6A6ASH9_9PLEO|nr:uncharacterized protein P153DRAFT_362286 [Dothidotthia symphoricarpi CBS 119687]KAF2134526.1 hypothetical protein P153DRAFT_362286 [Dothidotthia symphoricarpi CBS 119687]
MAAMEQDNSAPAIRFKRRKTTHPKRVYVENDVSTISTAQSPDAPTTIDARSPPRDALDEEDSVPNLKEILRNRKRPRNRPREASRAAEDTGMEMVQVDTSRPGQYTSRFIAQTGQVVDRDDKQMTEFVEARMAEKNYRQYGWPIPTHLQTSVAAIAPDLKHTFSTTSSRTGTTTGVDNPADVEHSNRLAAGQGKLQEVDLSSDAAAHNLQRTQNVFKREEEPPSKVRLGRDGKPRRGPKRRNSEDIRRDQMVEAVLRESKLEYFDEAPPNLHNPSTGDNDEAMVERFRLEYFESIESRQQRKPVLPPGPKGVKEPPKGPKLGGSRSARAAMRLQEEAAAKNKR